MRCVCAWACVGVCASGERWGEVRPVCYIFACVYVRVCACIYMCVETIRRRGGAVFEGKGRARFLYNSVDFLFDLVYNGDIINLNERKVRDE